MSATAANAAEFQDGGKPVAQPFYLVDVNGNPISSTNPQTVVATGNTASGTVDAGSSPVKIGGVAATSAPSQVAVGAAVQAWFGRNGQIVIALADINGATASMNAPGDQQGTQTGVSTIAQGMLYTGGGNWDRMRTPNIFKKIAAVSITAGTPVSVWTPAGGKKFRVMAWMLSLSVAGAILFEDTTGTEVFRSSLMAAGIGLASPNIGNGYLSTAANNQLFLDVTATGTVSGFICGIEE